MSEKFSYNYEEWSNDSRHFKIESDKKLSYDHIVDMICDWSLDLQKNKAVEVDDGISITYLGAEYGDDTQVSITGSELEE